MTQPSPSFKRKHLSSDSSQPPPVISLKERRRSHLKPLRIAPSTAASTTSSPSSITPTATLSSQPNWINTRSLSSRHPSPPPPTLPSSLPSTPYPTPVTSSSSSFTTTSTSATSSSAVTPTFNQKISYSNHLPEKQKRRRRSPEEFAELMSIFENTPKPCRQMREHLSGRLNMTIREVQIWFQNQRAKVNRQARLTPSTTSISNTSPTRRSTYPNCYDGYPSIPMTAIGLVHANPYAASSYQQATYPPFLASSTNMRNNPGNQEFFGNSMSMPYPASPVSVNDNRPSPSMYYYEGANLPATTGSSHQRSQSQPQLLSYSRYTMDDVRHHHHNFPSYPGSHAQQYPFAKGDHNSFSSSVPATPISSSPCSISSSEEKRNVTKEEVQTFADAMSLLAEVATQDQTQQEPSNVVEDSCKDERKETIGAERRQSLIPERTGSLKATDRKESHELDGDEDTMIPDERKMVDSEGGKSSIIALAEVEHVVEDEGVRSQGPVPLVITEEGQ